MSVLFFCHEAAPISLIDGHVAADAALCGQVNNRPLTDQPDLFPPDLFPVPVETVDPEEVRAELLEILATARDARDVLPWDRRTHQYHRVVFPQMANWLPEDEAEQLRRAFTSEMQRLELLAAKGS